MPPVTAERSPPDSRMTGADSPVIADSSTDATPSMISPSAGMNSPASTSTTSPLRRLAAGTTSVRPDRGEALGDGLGPRLAQRVGLRLAAPLGHRLGEVGEQHRQPEPERDLQLEAEPGPCRRPRRAISRSVVSTLPTSTTNMTGFFAIVRGCSLRSESQTAPLTICGSQIDFACACAIRTPVRSTSGSARRSGPRLSAGKKVSAPTITTTLTSRPRRAASSRGTFPATAARASCGPDCRQSPAAE